MKYHWKNDFNHQLYANKIMGLGWLLDYTYLLLLFKLLLVFFFEMEENQKILIYFIF